MGQKHQPGPLRLRKKHDPVVSRDITAADGERLVRAQSLRNAALASIIAVILFSILWVAVSDLLGRVFPWITLLLGWLLGLTVRLAGRGLDWRFPTLAAVFAVLGSLFVNVVAAASVTAQLLGSSTLAVLSNVTAMTWPLFFDEAMNAADILFALMAAALAAFFAQRRLTRAQNYSLRLWQESVGIDP